MDGEHGSRIEATPPKIDRRAEESNDEELEAPPPPTYSDDAKRRMKTQRPKTLINHHAANQKTGRDVAGKRRTATKRTERRKMAGRFGSPKPPALGLATASLEIHGGGRKSERNCRSTRGGELGKREIPRKRTKKPHAKTRKPQGNTPAATNEGSEFRPNHTRRSRAKG